MKIFGYTQDELAGANITRLIPPAQHAEHGTYMARLRAAPTPLSRHSFETAGVRKDGAMLPLDVSFSDLVIGGKRLFIGIVRDITERKQMEQAKKEFSCCRRYAASPGNRRPNRCCRILNMRS